MFITIGIIVVTLIVISGAAGAAASSNPNTGSGAGQVDDTCEKCRRNRAWYRDLNWRQKIAYSAWWGITQARCAIAGC